jgi:hypothetical protein
VDFRRVCGVVWFHEVDDTYSRDYSINREKGRFSDADLARILQNATEASAGAFKARGTPEVLRVVELLSIEQGRAWGVCTVSRHVPFVLCIGLSLIPLL